MPIEEVASRRRGCLHASIPVHPISGVNGCTVARGRELDNDRSAGGFAVGRYRFGGTLMRDEPGLAGGTNARERQECSCRSPNRNPESSGATCQMRRLHVCLAYSRMTMGK